MEIFGHGRNSRMPHDAVPNRCVLGLFVEVVTNADDLHFKVLRPIAILDIVVVLYSIFRSKTLQHAQRVLHVVVKVFAHKVIERFDSVVEDFHVVNGSDGKDSKNFKNRLNRLILPNSLSR